MNKGAILAANASGPHPNAGAALGTPGRALLLVAYIRPVCALLAPRRAGASTPRLGTLIHERVLSPLWREAAKRGEHHLPFGAVDEWKRREHVRELGFAELIGLRHVCVEVCEHRGVVPA